jgi:type II secretory pathway pseudopilin PulG
MVGVFVVAALAAILYPVLTRARQRALLHRCVSNLREIGLAAMAYTADNDETYPLARFGPHDGDRPEMRNWTWKCALLPYIDDSDALRCPGVTNYLPPCPDAPGARGDPGNACALRMVYEERGLWLPASYAWSGGFFRARDAHGKARPRRTGELADPSGILMIISSRLGGADIGPDAMEADDINPRTGLPEPASQGRWGAFPAHRGRIPVVMANGCVTTVTPLETVQPRDLWQSTDRNWDGRTATGCRRLLAAATAAQETVAEYY